MNAGKTDVGALARARADAAGLRVGACKLTDTGAGGDRYCYADAGAAEVLDFTDFGSVSTFQIPLDVLVRTAVAMHASLVARDVDVIVMEVADGLLCTDTAALIDAAEVRELVDGPVFRAGDAVGVRMLRGPAVAAAGGCGCWRCRAC